MAERRTITVHVLADARVHLALAYLGRLKQGRLETLCGKLAVTRLSPFAAAAAKGSDRCRVCFGKVDEDGLLKAELVPPRKERAPKPEAEVIDLAAARMAKASAVDSEAASEVQPPQVPTRATVAKKEPRASRPGGTKAATKAKPAAKAKPKRR